MLRRRFESYWRHHFNSLLAQLVEQMTVNHWVPGSSPGRGANLLGTVMKTKAVVRHNPVAKHAHKFNKAVVMQDKKRAASKRACREKNKK